MQNKRRKKTEKNQLISNIQMEYPKGKINREGVIILRKLEEEIKNKDNQLIWQEIPNSDIEEFMARGYTFADAQMVYKSFGFEDLQLNNGKYMVCITTKNALKLYNEMKAKEEVKENPI
ncbi:hypothetical protein [Bacteroides fragilis]|uniref:hypothetical protein n=1 Tax=Bacteroides fragilis TaxID=817 RepID=UPI001C703892|nr:hypothetical protein [Bacteroides fragilis]MBW9280199.1 hypothetical protein [Bacteroides fragilis]